MDTKLSDLIFDNSFFEIIRFIYPRQEEECLEAAGNPFAAPASVTASSVVKKSKSGWNR